MYSVRRAAQPIDWEQATALLWDYVEWFRAASGVDLMAAQPSFRSELAALEQRYAGSDQSLFVAYAGGLAVGTIAVNCQPSGRAELKRLYVRPVARGQRLADLLVGRALEAAVGCGCHVVWLESMRGPMDRAIAVYRRNGFNVVAEEGRSLSAEGVVVMEHHLGRHRRCA